VTTTIHKFDIGPRDYTRLPVQGRVRAVGFDPAAGVSPRGDEGLVAWVERTDLTDAVTVVEDAPTETFSTLVIRVYGTGHAIPADAGRYVGTAVGRTFVWHVYASGEVDL